MPTRSHKLPGNWSTHYKLAISYNKYCWSCSEKGAVVIYLLWDSPILARARQLTVGKPFFVDFEKISHCRVEELLSFIKIHDQALRFHPFFLLTVVILRFVASQGFWRKSMDLTYNLTRCESNACFISIPLNMCCYFPWIPWVRSKIQRPPDFPLFIHNDHGLADCDIQMVHNTLHKFEERIASIVRHPYSLLNLNIQGFNIWNFLDSL